MLARPEPLSKKEINDKFFSEALDWWCWVRKLFSEFYKIHKEISVLDDLVINCSTDSFKNVSILFFEECCQYCALIKQSHFKKI